MRCPRRSRNWMSCSSSSRRSDDGHSLAAGEFDQLGFDEAFQLIDALSSIGTWRAVGGARTQEATRDRFEGTVRSVRPDDAELVACWILQDTRRPLACLGA